MAELTREVLANRLRAAADDAYTMQGLGYYRLSSILRELSIAVEIEDDVLIDRLTFAARDELLKAEIEKKEA